jgi:hypothetical protein
MPRATAFLLCATTASALTGKKPFPRLRPLAAPRWAVSADDAFGIANEEAMLSANRPGQDSFDINVNTAKTDPFGYVDEEKVRLLQEQKAQTSFAGVSKGALGFAEPADSVPVTYATSTLKPSPSVAVPFLDRPAVLDEIALPGDAGFDPLGLATDAEALIRMRDAELKHGRLAMLAAVGWPLSELAQPSLANALHEPSLVFKQGGEVPSVLNGGLGDVPIVFWAGAVAVAIAAELAGLQATNEGKMPGDLGLKADLGLAGALGSEAAVADAETYNGRLAMLAVVAYVVQEFSAKLGGLPEPVVSQTYGLFHPLFL